MAIKPVSGEIKAQVINDNLSYLDSQVSSISIGPFDTYTSLSALQTAYPNGRNGFAVVLEADGKTGYMYTWTGTTWKKGGLAQAQGIADGTVTKKKLGFIPYNRLNFKRANFDVNKYCDFDQNGNFTIIEDAAGQILHNYKIYADQNGLGQAVRVVAQHINSNESKNTRAFIGINDCETIFANLLYNAVTSNYSLEIHLISRGLLIPNIFAQINNVASLADVLSVHTLTLRQIGNYLSIYFNDRLIKSFFSKTYFSSSFSASGASFRGTLNGNSHVKTIDAESLVTSYMHMSIDDVNSILRDLHDNRATYTSIFDNPNLAFLKSMHDKYGMCVSLYLFKTTASFDITNMTAKYRPEFAENAYWLKFGVHSKESGVNYNTTDPAIAVQDYTDIVNAIYTFAVPSNLDVIPRFENFGMSLACQRALHEANLPFEGTYGADDDRALSAGLTGDALTLVQNTDYYFDPKYQFFYPRSEVRLDAATKTSVTTQLDKLSRDISNNKIYGMFWHQGAELRQAQQEAIESACQWAVAHQVRFDFPQNNKPIL